MSEEAGIQIEQQQISHKPGMNSFILQGLDGRMELCLNRSTVFLLFSPVNLEEISGEQQLHNRLGG